MFDAFGHSFYLFSDLGCYPQIKLKIDCWQTNHWGIVLNEQFHIHLISDSTGETTLGVLKAICEATKELKWKKAEPLVESGEWEIYVGGPIT